MKVRTELIEQYCESNQCFSNVAALVRDRGGSAVMGWLVQPGGDFNCHIHHCVWKQPNGELVDVTPQDDPNLAYQAASMAKTVEFVPDESAALKDGYSLPARYEPTEDRFSKFVEYVNRSEAAWWAGNPQGAKYWTERAEKERHRAHGANGRSRNLRIEPADINHIRAVEPELIPYLSC